MVYKRHPITPVDHLAKKSEVKIVIKNELKWPQLSAKWLTMDSRRPSNSRKSEMATIFPTRLTLDSKESKMAPDVQIYLFGDNCGHFSSFLIKILTSLFWPDGRTSYL